MEYIEGLILRKLDYKESSKIIYLYTNQGLLSVLVHGSNKAKSPYLNLSRVMNYVGLHISGKDLKTLRDGDVINDFRELKQDLEKFTYCQHILELVYNFANHEHDHEKLLQFLIKIFQLLESPKTDYMLYLNMIELKLLHLLGVNPLFQHCVSCEETAELKFSIEEGGMCCTNHYHSSIMSVSNNAVKLMMNLYYFDLQNPHQLVYDAETLKEIRVIIDRYYEYHLSFRSNSRKMLMGLIGY